MTFPRPRSAPPPPCARPDRGRGRGRTCDPRRVRPQPCRRDTPSPAGSPSPRTTRRHPHRASDPKDCPPRCNSSSAGAKRERSPSPAATVRSKHLYRVPFSVERLRPEGFYRYTFKLACDRAGLAALSRVTLHVRRSRSGVPGADDIEAFRDDGPRAGHGCAVEKAGLVGPISG